MFSKKENENAVMFMLRWIARVLSLAVLFILVLFYIGEGFSFAAISAREYIGLLFFPVGLAIGYAVGWQNELVGGCISTLSVIAFYLIYGLLVGGSIRQGWAFAVFTIPGILYLVHGVLSRVWFRTDGHRASV